MTRGFPFISSPMFFATCTDCFSVLTNCGLNTLEMSPTAQTSVVPLALKNSSTTTNPFEFRSPWGMYDELGRRPTVGRYRSVVIFWPSESVSSVLPSGLVADPEILVSSLILTLSSCSFLVAALVTLAGVPSRI